MESRPSTSRRRPEAARQRAVERAEAYLKAHLDSPIPLAHLCHVTGLSERGLRNAFYRVRGMSPTRCLRTERLHGVRNALRGEWSSPITVTDVAIGHGFSELGRFSMTYREEFGESPSETLRRHTQHASDLYRTTQEVSHVSGNH